MLLQAFLASSAVALSAIIGALFFGDRKELIGVQRYVVPVAVGILLSFVLYELIPETLALSPQYGGLLIAFGFIGFYVLANYLHQRFHAMAADDCDRKTAASLFLIGDATHNLADGVILGSAFLIDPTVGIATAVGLALHEVPQEIIEFGVLVRAGYSRTQAILRNLASASTIVIGTMLTLGVAEVASDYLFVITGIAAGNLLFLAASELLPRIHGNLQNYGSIWHATLAIILGFVAMTVIVNWAHSHAGHGHDHHDHTHEATHDDDHNGHDGH